MLGALFAILSAATMAFNNAAARRGVVIGFWDYFRVGAPLTVLTLLVGTLWLMWR